MPELPDITVYIEALAARIVGQELKQMRLKSPFLLRTIDPAPEDFLGQRVDSLRRLGKRIAIGFDGELWIILHLMIAGRLHWKSPGAKLGGTRDLAAFDFSTGSLVLTEAGKQHRAALHLVRGNEALNAHDPGGLDIFTAELPQFAAALARRNHTLKRALADPSLLSGIGNAYSDEILHRARLSPFALTQKLPPADVAKLLAACREVLNEWTERLRQEAGDGFPEGVTAFRPEMAVHGRYGKPCPVCGAPVQRVRYAQNEANYCPGCQTDGRIYADRSLSRLLKDDWPRHLDEL